MLVTKRLDGSIAIAVWNLSLPDDPGRTRDITVHLQNLKGTHRAQISEIDPAHGSPLPAYHAMGDPVSPTAAQYAELKKSAQLPLPHAETIKNGSLSIVLPAKSLFLIEIR